MSDFFANERAKAKLGLIKNSQILDKDYVASSLDEVIGREEEKAKIRKFLWDVVHDGKRCDINLVGITGIGKTILVKTALSWLSNTEEFRDTFTYSFVNCKALSPPTKYKLHQAILAPHDHTFGLGKGEAQTTPVIKSILAQRPFIVVLDEVDNLVSAKGDLLYDLLELGLSQIFISNVFNWDEKAESRTQSRAQSNKFIFEPYSDTEIFEVLRYICDMALAPGVVPDDMLSIVANHVLDNFLGDIRKGKNLLSEGVAHAQDEGVKVVKPHHIELGLNSMKRVGLSQELSSYTKKELIALASVVSLRLEIYIRSKGEYHEPTSRNVHEMFTKNVKLNGGKLVDMPQMINLLRRFVTGQLIYSNVGSHPTRGRTRYWHLSEDNSDEDYLRALEDNGVKVWRDAVIGDLFR